MLNQNQYNFKIVKKVFSGILYLCVLGTLIFIGYTREHRKIPAFKQNHEILKKQIPGSSFQNTDSLFFALENKFEILEVENVKE